MMQSSHDATIQKLYDVFTSYSLGEKFGNCDWLQKEAIQTIKLKPLRTLTSQDVSSYVSHAWSCGSESDFKYLLPRILELFALGELEDTVTPDLFLGSLPHNSWPKDEREVIDAFLIEVWASLMNTFPFPYEPDEFLCGLAQIYPDLKKFLDFWQGNISQPALRQLALFVAHATYCGSWEQRPAQKQQITTWLLSPSVIKMLEKGSVAFKDQPFNAELLEAINIIKQWQNAFKSE
jgi:hypothetical protein